MRTNDSATVLPMLEQPSVSDGLIFYSTLRGSPRLIARSFPWHASQVPRGVAPPRLEVDDVFLGFFLELWTTPKPVAGEPGSIMLSMCDRVEAAINRLPWRSLDFVHIGDSQTPVDDRDIVVWIGLGMGSYITESWDIIADVMRSVRILLDSEGLTFFDIQIWEPTFEIDTAALDEALLLSNPHAQ
ncbi:hypothetical protein F503_06909 [Ophiostoma piceae UAMH 11346]|uniref:Uncharacterized protein n=1 Tax=Ophiostoma piceae (strain UAMH 11346) TaxID=1262450 RepID=S3CRA0_OPHP1|nr:hypothetical protein F503_06909 [Ophiostoma piceae UAMH 11346]